MNFTNSTFLHNYQDPEKRSSIQKLLIAALGVNLSTLVFITIRLKLSPYIKKVLIGLQMSNLLVISLMLAGLFTIEQHLAEQWPFGLACDTATIFFHNSFAYSHLISRVRFHMAQNTSQLKGISIITITSWTINFTIYICVVSCLIILSSTVFEVCIVAYNPCLSGLNEIGFFINIGMTFIAMVNLGYCFKFDLALVRLIKDRQKIKPIQTISWTQSKDLKEKLAQPNYTIPISTSVYTIVKFVAAMINFIKIQILKEDPQGNSYGFPFILMIDIPLILALTVRSNDKKQKPIVMPPTGLQDDGEEFYYISQSRVKSKRLKRRWTSHFDHKENNLYMNRSLCTKCKRNYLPIEGATTSSTIKNCSNCLKRNSTH